MKMGFLNISIGLLFAALLPINYCMASVDEETIVLDELYRLVRDADNWTQEGGFKDVPEEDGPVNLNWLLHKAYIKVIGEYRHRGQASKALRTAVRAHPKYEKHFHAIYGFNKQSNVSHPDIIEVVKAAKRILLIKQP